MAQIASASQTQAEVRIGVLPLYGAEQRQEQAQASLWRQLAAAFPQISFRFLGLGAPFSDDDGREYFFDGANWKKPGVGATKLLRGELLGGLAFALRNCAERKVHAVVGFEQGGLIAALMASPRLVEAALFRRAVPVAEAPELSATWHGLRVFLCLSPLYRVSGCTLKQVREALPELAYPSAAEQRRPVFHVGACAAGQGDVVR